jgi:hypothetical protein
MGTKVSVAGLTDVAVETGKNVSAVYDNDWYIECITAQNNECDILVKFMERKGQDILTFLWPQREDKCHIQFNHVLCTVPAPSLNGRSGWQYRLEHALTDIVRNNFLQYTEKKKE